MRKNTNPPDRVLKNPPGIPEYYAPYPTEYGAGRNTTEKRATLLTGGAFLGVCFVASNSYNVRNVNSSGAMNWSTANE